MGKTHFADFALLTYLFTYLHTHHVMYWASYSLEFIALVCA